MSTLKTNTLTGTTSAGSILVTGEGGSTTTNLQQGLCKSWVDFSMNPSNAILDSLNTSSFTDEGTGEAEITITNPFSSANWACAGGAWGTDAANGDIIPNAGNAGNTNKYWFSTFWHSGDVYDMQNIHGMTFGDLA